MVLTSLMPLKRRIERVLSHGKHLVGLIEGNYYFHSHLMMWGSWAVLDNPPQEIDRRERSRIVVPDACAILYSAPIFDLGAGNPFEIVENLRPLGTDILPYPAELKSTQKELETVYEEMQFIDTSTS